MLLGQPALAKKQDYVEKENRFLSAAEVQKSSRGKTEVQTFFFSFNPRKMSETLQAT